MPPSGTVEPIMQFQTINSRNPIICKAMAIDMAMIYNLIIALPRSTPHLRRKQ